MDHLAALRSLVENGRLGLLIDFDGTIVHIASTPDEAALSPRVSELLRQLAIKIQLVSVVSGRAVRDLRGKVGLEEIVYVGNHGAEYLNGDELTVEPGLASFRPKLVRLLDHLKAQVAVPGIVWDDKHHGVSVHYKLTDDPDDTRRLLAAALKSIPERDDLQVFWGKMVMEIRPAMGLDKGHAVRKLAREHHLDGAVVLGDDTTDIDAFVALEGLRSAGQLEGVAVAVLHHDTPAELVQASDYALEGVPEVERFLEWLVSAAGQGC